MKLLEWLNKLGILRWGGTAGVYRNAKDRPIELQEPGVFNAERDLVKCGKPTTTKPGATEPLKSTQCDGVGKGCGCRKV